MEYSQELINAVIKYNENLDSIANKILKLKIKNEEDIKVNNLNSLFSKLKVINSVKSRKQTEFLLQEIENEYGYQLEGWTRKSEE